MASTVGRKGQVVIEKRIRDELGIEPGSIAIQRVVDGRVEIQFVTPRRESLYGSLAEYVTRSISQEEWEERREEIVGQAIADEWREREQAIAAEQAEQTKAVAEETADYERNHK